MQGLDYKQLDENSQPGAFSIYDIEIFVPELLKLKPFDRYVEIGVDRGKSLSIARKVTDPRVKIYGIDIVSTPELKEWLKTEPDVKFIQKDSGEVAKYFGVSINLLFIDGNHGYDFVKADIYSWLPKMKKGGVILFHDYGVNPDGVKEAVDEFMISCPGIKFYDLSNSKTSMVKIQL